MSLYTGSLLADADRVLASTLYNFQRGGATLLEVLNAQRTVNEVYLACYDALADHARQLIAVEQAAAMWDVQF
jgi:cobalt-zinc-cadmium efflux system outer membrane protein